MPLADQHGIDLGFAADVTATVQANRDDLRSLFHNLIDNALRYAPEDGIVDVRLSGEGSTVTVDIVDNGPGIPPELLPRVFDRFFRIEGSGGEGSGLGLAIARNAAERNHVDLELSNRTDGCGLIARVRFQTPPPPFEVAAPARTHAERTRHETAAGPIARQRSNQTSV
jgi:signal transduction histidine kinase